MSTGTIGTPVSLTKEQRTEAIANAPVSNQGSASSDQNGKRAQRRLVKYPGLFDADGNPQQLEAFPDDFNPSEHSPFIRKDFKDETIWLNWRADELEKKAAGYREEAEMIKRFGSDSERKQAQQLLKLREKFEALKKQMSTGENAIDVDALLATLGG